MKHLLYAMFVLFVMLALASLTEATKNCSLPPEEIVPDSKLSPFTYYSSSEAGIPKEEDCHYKIRVPNGTYASISFQVAMATVTFVTDYGKKIIRNQNGIFESLTGEVTMTLASHYSTAELNFTVTWGYECTPNENVKWLTKTAADNYVVANFGDLQSNTPVTLKSDTKIALSVSDNLRLLGYPNNDVVVYDGDSINATRLGPMVQVFSRFEAVFSSGNALTLFYPMPDKKFNENGIMIFHDAESVKDLSCYTLRVVTNVSEFTSPFCLGRSAVTLYPAFGLIELGGLLSTKDDGSERVNSFSVYAGGVPPPSDKPLASYRNTTDFSFPQIYVPGPITLVSDLEEDNDDIYFVADPTSGEEVLEYSVEQDGYVFSNNFGRNATQFVRRNISYVRGDELMPTEFTLNFVSIDLPEGATIELEIAGNIRSYNAKSIPKNGKMVFYGNTFTVTYDTKNKTANGLKLYYSLGYTRPNSSAHNVISSLILLISIVMSHVI